jgi:hypothetical protein
MPPDAGCPDSNRRIQTPDVRIRRSARRTVLARQARTMFNQQIKILDQGLRGAASATPPDMRGPGGGGGGRAPAGPAARRGASLKPASGLFGWGQAPTTLLVLCGRVAQSEVVGRAASYQRDGRAAGYACVRTTWRAIPLVSRKPGGCLSRPHAAVWSGKGIQLDCSSACNCQPTSSGTAPPLPSQAPQEGCSARAGLQWAAVGCRGGGGRGGCNWRVVMPRRVRTSIGAWGQPGGLVRGINLVDPTGLGVGSKNKTPTLTLTSQARRQP